VEEGEEKKKKDDAQDIDKPNEFRILTPFDIAVALDYVKNVVDYVLLTLMKSRRQ
jgi:hypothetical protein